MDGTGQIVDGLGHVAEPDVDAEGTLRCARRRRGPASDTSTAVTLHCGTSVARPPRPRPEPVHRSTATGCATPAETSRFSSSTAAPVEQLGLGPRHEDAGSDREVEVAEPRGAGQVLERLPRGAALDTELGRPVAHLGAETAGGEPDRLLVVPTAKASNASASWRGDSTPAPRAQPLHRLVEEAADVVAH